MNDPWNDAPFVEDLLDAVALANAKDCYVRTKLWDRELLVKKGDTAGKIIDRIFACDGD